MDVKFILEKRKNVFTKDGEEYALRVVINKDHGWVLETWEGPKEPNTDEVNRAKELILRSFEVYHHHIDWPKFNVNVIE